METDKEIMEEMEREAAPAQEPVPEPGSGTGLACYDASNRAARGRASYTGTAGGGKN